MVRIRLFLLQNKDTDGWWIRFAFSPVAKIMVRLGQALAGGARSRRIEMGSNPPSEYLYQTKKPSPLGLGFGLAVLNLMYILG